MSGWPYPGRDQPGAVLTTGLLNTELGAPTAGEVRVYAFDLPATTKGVAELPHLGTGQAGTDGQFVVNAIDDARLIRLAKPRGGWIDFVAVADTQAGRRDGDSPRSSMPQRALHGS